MIITTTPAIDGKRVAKYLGLVTGEAILGANVFKDFFAGIRDIVGGRSAAYEGELRRARDIAIQEITKAATDLGADRLTARGAFEIKQTDFGISPISVAGVVKVKNELAISFALAAQAR
jgi:uncharacterized protein YbjQ (UPF0145 family)